MSRPPSPLEQVKLWLEVDPARSTALSRNVHLLVAAVEASRDLSRGPWDTNKQWGDFCRALSRATEPSE
jgi:hypothetical protein